MSPITHFLATWVGFESCLRTSRDRALVCAAGLAPDLDGLGIVVDFTTRLLGLPETDFYQSTHRLYGHGITAALVFAALVAALGCDRLRVGLLAFVAVHLHFLCDLIGSRGSEPEDLWGLYYLGPWNVQDEIVWPGQWPLVGWQNFLITAILMALLLERASRKGYSPIGLVSRRADQALIAVLQGWRQALSRRFL